MKRMMLLGIVLLLSFYPKKTFGDEAANIEANLLRFRANPRLFMAEIPPKKTFVSPGVRTMANRFPQNKIRNFEYLNIKNKDRQRTCFIFGEKKICPKSASENLSRLDTVMPEDQDVTFFMEGEKVLRSLSKIEKLGLENVEIDHRPWSDHYWPIFRGGIAAPYGDLGLSWSDDWKRNFEVFSGRPVFLTNEQLSPAEKYDLLLGDPQKSLTRSMWAEGESYYSTDQKVESWMGYCHGWAAAALRVPRPKRVVLIPVAQAPGQFLKLYPTDIKAMATLLWANAEVSNVFMGGRCEDKNPKVDDNGHIISTDCFDVNPASWHTVLVNRLGVLKRPFVFDAAYDYEVWNQPVVGYTYTYFNPETLKARKTFESAKISMHEFKSDKFTKYRSPEAKSIVGITLDLIYLNEVAPSQRETDGPEYDGFRTVRYTYDLELNGKDEPIGGEWYQRAHPDFMWAPTQDARAMTFIDPYLKGEWESNVGVPSSWQEAGVKISEFGLPLARVVEELVKRSQ